MNTLETMLTTLKQKWQRELDNEVAYLEEDAKGRSRYDDPPDTYDYQVASYSVKLIAAIERGDREATEFYLDMVEEDDLLRLYAAWFLGHDPQTPIQYYWRDDWREQPTPEVLDKIQKKIEATRLHSRPFSVRFQENPAVLDEYASGDAINHLMYDLKPTSREEIDKISDLIAQKFREYEALRGFHDEWLAGKIAEWEKEHSGN